MTVRFNGQGARACPRSRISPPKPSAALRSQIPTRKRAVRSRNITTHDSSLFLVILLLINVKDLFIYLSLSLSSFSSLLFSFFHSSSSFVNQDTSPVPTLWIGTSLGSIQTVIFNTPARGERHAHPVVVSTCSK